jgi:large subunit ribosomal protein L23
MIRPIASEKAVRLIELNNTLVFEVDKRKTKNEIKKEIEEGFKVKVDDVNTLIRKNKKYVYAKLNLKNPAIDVATKLGMI